MPLHLWIYKWYVMIYSIFVYDEDFYKAWYTNEKEMWESKLGWKDPLTLLWDAHTVPLGAKPRIWETLGRIIPSNDNDVDSNSDVNIFCKMKGQEKSDSTVSYRRTQSNQISELDYRKNFVLLIRQNCLFIALYFCSYMFGRGFIGVHSLQYNLIH